MSCPIGSSRRLKEWAFVTALRADDQGVAQAEQRNKRAIWEGAVVPFNWLDRRNRPWSKLASVKTSSMDQTLRM